MSFLLSCMFAGFAPVDTPREEEIKKELEKLQGVWRFTGMEFNGQPNPAAITDATARPKDFKSEKESVMTFERDAKVTKEMAAAELKKRRMPR